MWSSAAPLLLLAFLAEDALVGIFDALALVGLRRPIFADFGCDLPDLLAIRARNHDLDRPRRGNRDALRDRIDNVMTIAERELQVLALHRGAVADPVDLEPALKSLADAGDQVRDQRARSAPLRAGALGVVARIDFDPAAFQLHGDVVRDDRRQRAFRAFEFHGLALDVGGDARGYRDRSFSDAGHDFSYSLSLLEHGAENFAADIGVARVVVGHDALRR